MRSRALDGLWCLLSIKLSLIMLLLGAVCGPPLWLIRWLRDKPFTQRIEDTRDGTLYLWRLFLTPKTRLGGLYLHVFHRGDQDRDHHDHPWWFLTFPLHSYWEQVLRDDGTLELVHVKRLRMHFRPARYRHRVIGRTFIEDQSTGLDCQSYGYTQPADDGKIVTLIWHGGVSRKWGFWVDATRTLYEDVISPEPYLRMAGWASWRKFIPWRRYLH